MLAAEGGQTETISRIAVINHESIVVYLRLYR